MMPDKAISGAGSEHPELTIFHSAVREWFASVFPAPTRPQTLGWPAIARGDSTLILAPTGTSKTLAAFLWCMNRLMFRPKPPEPARCRVVYISPIKALAVDVERNLQAPLAGIAQAAQRLGVEFHEPSIAIRTGDTPQNERVRFARHPTDILITTPESLYLLLTANVREILRSVEAVIVDEIHALVPSKRGSHLALSLERLEHLAGRKLQRIGLSATQRPLDEVARFLGGATVTVLPGSPDGSATEPAPDQLADSTSPERSGATRDADRVEVPGTLSTADADGRLAGTERTARTESGGRTETTEAGDELRSEFAAPALAPMWRPVSIVDAGTRRTLELRIEVPVEDMARIGEPIEIPSGPAAQGPVRSSIWTAIHPRLVDLVREHRTTLIFVNSRRIAERLAAALNELAGEPLARAHHGSLARAQRVEIEDALKAGRVRALVATSSLELGIDMGAIDLVVQIEAPPSVASGMQRIGRAGHRIDAPSTGVIFPKYRGDLVACAALTQAMTEGRVEAIRYPRNP